MWGKEVFNFFIVPLGGAAVRVGQDVYLSCCPKSWMPRSVPSLMTSDLAYLCLLGPGCATYLVVMLWHILSQLQSFMYFISLQTVLWLLTLWNSLFSWIVMHWMLDILRWYLISVCCFIIFSLKALLLRVMWSKHWEGLYLIRDIISHFVKFLQVWCINVRDFQAKSNINRKQKMFHSR